MKKYLVLYHSEAALSGMTVTEMFARSTPEQLKAGMGAWQSWHEKSGSAVVDLGAPLDKSTTVVAGGSASPGKTSISGYTVVEAGSMDDAVALMKEHPHFYGPGSSVQILECVQLPGF
jgi:hypothetical protein